MIKLNNTIAKFLGVLKCNNTNNPPSNTEADAWGAANDGQYQSSGRWYYSGVYVGDESAYNAAVAAQLISDANAWGATTNGHYQSSGRW